MRSSMNTPDTEWEKEFDEKFHYIKDFVVKDNDFGERDWTDIKNHISTLLTSRDSYWKERVSKDNLMGMIVKNSTGFDTIGNQRLWHLDIDAFEADLDTLLDNLK